MKRNLISSLVAAFLFFAEAAGALTIAGQASSWQWYSITLSSPAPEAVCIQLRGLALSGDPDLYVQTNTTNQ